VNPNNRIRNRIDQRILKEKMLQENFKRITVSFYNYFEIEETQLFRDNLFIALENLQVFGRIYLATEGINAQISVPEMQWKAFTDYMNTFPAFVGIRYNIAVEDDGKSFWVLKIKVRDKIVADGISDKSFSMQKKGKYVNAKQYNELSKDQDTIIVDMRNHYEYEVGHFKNAIEIPSNTFREQLPMAVEMLQDKKDKNIIMYCTGGIRCEKASAYMLHHGFENVYHVEGGIINYARQAKEANLDIEFVGKNFVFDDRLGERITEDVIAQCHQCGDACDEHTNCANDACHLLFIQCENCKNIFEACCSEACFEENKLPIEEQKLRRANLDGGQKIFNKAKENLRPRPNYRLNT
jgi:UPF0176 protein